MTFSTDPVSVLQALQRCTALRYSHTIYSCDINGVISAPLTVVAGSSPATVARDCTADTHGTLDFETEDLLTWGSDFVTPVLSIASPEYQAGDPQEFQLGVYIATSPETALSEGATHRVTCYDKNYLLTGDVGDSFSANAGDLYSTRVAQLMSMAGITSALSGGVINPDVVNFSGDWVTKTVPSGKDMVYPSDDSNNYTYLQIINELLKASGCRKLYTSQTGKFTVDVIVKPETQGSRWAFSRYPTDIRDAVVVMDSAFLEGDVWGLPNQFVYIQSGLTFDPTHTDGSDGMYVINNAISDPVHYRRPSDQGTIGRVIRSVRRLDASGSADLIAQAEQDFTDTFSGAEQIKLSTAPWPVAWHYDVFKYTDPSLPRALARKVQTQSWSLPLDGISDMTWQTNVVADA